MSSSDIPDTGVDGPDNTSVERVFLHDLSNHLAIVQGQMQILSRKIQKNPGEIKIEDITKSLESALTAVGKAVIALKERRELLRNRAQ